MKNKFALARRTALSRFAVLGVLLALAVLLASCATEIQEIVKVTFDANGGGPTPAAKELAKGAALGNVQSPTKTGYEFLGWFHGFDLYGASTTVNNDITLVAKWKNPDVNTVLVTFVATGAVPAETIVEVAVGKKLGPLFPVDPRRQGRQFTGWTVGVSATAGGESFTVDSVVTETLTLVANWVFKQQYIVTLSVPEVHRAANPGIHGKTFQVYENDSIDEWVKQFPATMGKAADPTTFQYHQFFRWAENGSDTGIIYTERTPITKSVTLGAIYGLYFNKNTFDVDLESIYDNTSMNDYRTGEFWDELPDDFKYPMTNAQDVIENPTREPNTTDVTKNADGSVSFTVLASPAIMYFRTPPELWKLLKYAEVANDTKVSFWLDYEFEDPAKENDDNVTNIFFGNLVNNDNWNSTEVRDLKWKDIVYGEGYDPTSGNAPAPELHKLAGTIINFDQNVDWIIFRMARGTGAENVLPFRMTIKGFKVTLEQ